MVHILYNPLSGNGRGRDKAEQARSLFPGQEVMLTDLTTLEPMAFLHTLSADDRAVIAGGDGTLNQFANTIPPQGLPCPVYYYPTGSGNDFGNDVHTAVENGLILLNDYLRRLPQVVVNGRAHRFLNGIGYGIDGYCCEEGDRRRERSEKAVNYTAIALKGLLFAFKPTNATVTVDGLTRHYRRVWLVPTMQGRFFGGGMMIAPEQNRQNSDHHVTTVVVHGVNKWTLLCRFLTIFKGTHVRYKKMVDILTGHEVTVTFDRPTPLQIDGETVRNVSSYTVHADCSTPVASV